MKQEKQNIKESVPCKPKGKMRKARRSEAGKAVDITRPAFRSAEASAMLLSRFHAPIKGLTEVPQQAASGQAGGRLHKRRPVARPLFAHDANALVATLCHWAWPVKFASRASGLEQDKRSMASDLQIWHGTFCHRPRIDAAKPCSTPR